LGSYVQWDRRLDGRIAQAICSINAFKGVGFGLGFAATTKRGSETHDVIQAIDKWDERLWSHETNRHGGIEGGITTGEEIIVRAAVKPIPTLANPLPSVDLETGEEVLAHYERSDVCVVPAAGIVAEAMVAIILADAWIEKFGGDTIEEIEDNFKNSQKSLKPRKA
jgi:chorismate synthase